LTVNRSSDFDREPELFEDWLIPATPVELVRLDERWRQQDWGCPTTGRTCTARAASQPGSRTMPTRCGVVAVPDARAAGCRLSC
jgi:hypothetical protein